MLLGTLDQPETYVPFLNHALWTRILDWLHRHQEHLPPNGEHEIESRYVRAIVQTVETEPREKKFNYEVHRREIDLHYCADGSELIEWYAPASDLVPQTEYEEQKDFQLFSAPTSTTPIRLTPGRLAIFFPGEGHMPGIRCDDLRVQKAVIKIDASLLAGQTVILGPFDVTLPSGHTDSMLFNTWLEEGHFDRANTADINVDNFLLKRGRHGEESKEIYLVNLGEPIHNKDAPDKLHAIGYRSVAPEWVLGLNAKHQHLMEDHIIITTQTKWIGRENVPEVLCLHKDAGKRRLRTHYADTIWGSHIWFATEKIAA